MRKTTRLTKIFIAVLVALFLAFPAVSSAAPEMTLRFANQVPVEHTCTKLMYQVAEEVKEKTNGRI